MSYYENAQWSAAGQANWEHQAPPARSGANSAIPREEPTAFAYQIEEVDRAVDNLLKSGKMFGMPGARHPRMGPAAGGRPHPIADYGDVRGPHPSSNLQNFYASQRHQSSRGSNEAEQMMQAKRRMAAQRERELRNYHQEQQYNRNVLAELTSYGNKPDRTLSPGSMSEEERRELIARQRSALYGEGPFAEAGGYIDETGTPRPGVPGPHNGSSTLRGHSPLAYEYGLAPPVHPEAGPQLPAEGGQGSQPTAPNEPSRANSTSSPQSNPPTGSQQQQQQQSTRTSASSPGGSPPRTGAPSGKPGQGPTVAPIGTRPSGTSATPVNSALSKRSTTPLPSPLSQGHSAPDNDGNTIATTSGAPSNPSSAAADGPSVGISGWGGARSGVWGNKSGLGVQASVWG